MTHVPDVAEVVSQYVPELPPEVLISALHEREDAIADFLRELGPRFGLYPEIVAECIAESGLGTPIPDDVRALIHAQYVGLMGRLAAEYRNNRPEGGPDLPPAPLT
jgi:hypothetical protein